MVSMQRTRRLRNTVELVLALAAILALAFIAQQQFIRIDLTSEKRHTLTPVARDLMVNLPDVVYIQVYLAGDLPPDYKRLEQAVREKLDEMRAYSQGKLEYEFIDPNEAEDEKSRVEFYEDLVSKGLDYSSLQSREKDGLREQIVFPAAIINFRSQQIPLQLIKARQRVPDALTINSAINALEFELTLAIRQVTRPERPRVAFLEGHGELIEQQTASLEAELLKLYDVARVRIDGQLGALAKQSLTDEKWENLYDVLVVAQPDSAFDEKDKFIIDQFIMRGGSVLWLVDAMSANLDSLRRADLTMAVPTDLNLDDQLFIYGARINHNLVIDRSAAPIGLMTGPSGNQQMELFPWYVSPISVPQNCHPIVATIEPVAFEFASSIDTLPRPGVKQTVLLTSSPYSRSLRSPVRVSLSMVRVDPGFAERTDAGLPLAVLLEGTFQSAFKNRLSPLIADDESIAFLEKSEPTRMLVVGDGEIARNIYDPSSGNIYPLGYDRYTRQKIFGNREFLVNAINYMLGDEALIGVRNRTVALRLLNEELILRYRNQIQAINLILPAGLVVFVGMFFVWLRKRRYARRRA